MKIQRFTDLVATLEQTFFYPIDYGNVAKPFQLATIQQGVLYIMID